MDTWASYYFKLSYFSIRLITFKDLMFSILVILSLSMVQAV